MKTYICFLGLPGVGKSTQIEILKSQLGKACDVFHAGKYAKSIGIPKPANGALATAPGLAEKFLEHCASSSADIVILDGFPRSLEQVEAMKGLDRVIVLHFDGDVKLSKQRQKAREGTYGVREQGKVKRALEHDVPAIQAVSSMFFTRLITQGSIENMQHQVVNAIGVGFLYLDEACRKIAIELQRALMTGESAMLTSSSAYRPFLNGRVGPMQEPNDVDAGVYLYQTVQQLKDKAPTGRLWALKDGHLDNKWFDLERKPISLQRIGYVINSATEPFANIEFKYATLSDAYDTICGELRIVNPHDPKAHSKAAKIARQYPAIKGDVPNPAGVQVLTEWSDIHKSADAHDLGYRSWALYETNPTDATRMEVLRRRFNALTPKASAPPRYRRFTFPEDYPTDSADLYRSRPEVFRETLYRAANSSRTVQLDPFSKYVLRFEFLSPGDAVNMQQKATHQGWPLEFHLRECALQLDVSGTIDPEYAAVLRVAALVHDIGKMWDSRTAGGHGGLAERVYKKEISKVVDEFIKPRVTNFHKIVQVLIRLHDLPGRVSRSVTEIGAHGEPTYKGAIHPQQARDMVRGAANSCGLTYDTMLNFIFTIWRADVASVSSLRWLLDKDYQHALSALFFRY